MQADGGGDQVWGQSGGQGGRVKGKGKKVRK